MRTTLALILAIVFSFAAFGQDQTPDVQPSADGFYYKTPQGYQKLEALTIAGAGAKHAARAFVPGLMPEMIYTYRGAEAPVQIMEKRPTFYIKQTPLPAAMTIPGRSGRDLVILHLDVRKDHRELQISNGTIDYKVGISKDRMPDITTKTLADGVFVVTPSEDLKPGQYMVTFASFASMGYSGFDFGIK